jgi:hypothetical protein
MNLVYFLTTLSEWEDRHPILIVEEMLAARLIQGSTSVK